jgi:hypothetical protein
MQWIVLAGVVVTFMTAVLGFLQLRRKVAAVHVLVNSQLTTVIDRVAQLTQALTASGIDVPPPPPAT